jgi:hypothetical protein
MNHPVTTYARPWRLLFILFVSSLLGACGGSDPEPIITAQPVDTAVVAGSAATLSVGAAGNGISYEWQSSSDGIVWTAVPGGTASSYTTPVTSAADNGRQFRVVVSAGGARVTSSAVRLTVTVPVVAPAITVQPVAQSVNVPDPASFGVTASGSALNYQWQRSIDGGATWADIAGATAATFNTGATMMAMNDGRYRVVVSNAGGSVISSTVVLTVALSGVPGITGQPANVTISAGQGATFVVGVSGTPTPTVQWQLSTDNGASWSDINGATGDVLTLPAGVPLAHNGRQFRAVASNAAGSATSGAAVLTVNPSLGGVFQFNLFGFNASPAVFLLYGGSVRDSAGTIECSGYAALNDPCPKWTGDYANGTSLTLTARPWPGWRVIGWTGDCSAAGAVLTVTLTIDHNSNCRPQFELIPGSQFSISAAAAGAWVGLVVEVTSSLVVSTTPRISCGPLSSTQICEASVDAGASPYTVMRLKAFALFGAPAGQLRWTCTSSSPDDGSPVLRTVVGDDIAIGPIYSNTGCSAELVPTL